MKPASTVDEFLLAMADQMSVMDLRGLLAEGCINFFYRLAPHNSTSGNFAIGVAVGTTALARPMVKLEIDVQQAHSNGLDCQLELWFTRDVPPCKVEWRRYGGTQSTGYPSEYDIRRDYLNKLLLPVLQAKIRKGLTKQAT